MVIVFILVRGFILVWTGYVNDNGQNGEGRQMLEVSMLSLQIFFYQSMISNIIYMMLSINSLVLEVGVVCLPNGLQNICFLSIDQHTCTCHVSERVQN